MASLSRLEKFGTLFTRVRDLMRAGVMKEADKPLWYDVMAAFPPRDEPTYHREYTHDFLPQILYEEDKLRSQFYKVYGNHMSMDLTNQDSVNRSPCHRFITKYNELQTEGNTDPEQLFEATASALAQDGLVLTKQSERRQRKQKVDAKPEVGSVKGLALLLQNALETQDNPPEGASIASSPASQEVEKDER
ncbi:28S ribosomal protein S23, mitochondrial-like [Asterias rubens]|uniref:28S ribosomal protein S23, mitochondrial-like n=1 Tax=Asterias rubens TaxID=7604 RepID=UPI0014555B55|nr:28S ribosomal protein S23, mitochondrial-like [Asterias rubens]